MMVSAALLECRVRPMLRGKFALVHHAFADRRYGSSVRCTINAPKSRA